MRDPVEGFSRRLRSMQRLVGSRPHTFALITGPPRSGTTAMSEWLGTQPGVRALSESRILIAAHRFLQEVGRLKSLDRSSAELEARIGGLVFGYYGDRHWLLGRSILVDKEPLGHIALSDGSHSDFLENVLRISPGAKLVLMIRHPIATIWSMQQRAWGYSLVHGTPARGSLEEDIGRWRAAAGVVAEYSSRPDTLLCRFEELVRNPDEESARILDFLGVENGVPFEPQPTRDVAFSAETMELIMEKTAREVESLGLGETPVPQV